MDDIEDCKRLMKVLEAEHQSLIDLLVVNSSAVIGFNIEQILAKDEADTIKNGIDTLDVQLATRISTLQFHRKYYRDHSLSTLFVERKPGLIVLNTQQTAVRTHVVSINKLKDTIMEMVNTNRDKHQRHEFMHRAFPRIMTDQFRRHIHIIDKPVSNAWFNWTSRPVPETFTIKEAIKYLENEKDNVKGLIDPKEWEAMLNININDLRGGQFKSVQRLKALKLLPIMTYKYKTELGEEKRNTKNANTPILLFNQDDHQLPKLSPLPCYAKPTDDQIKKSRAKKKTILNPYLKLVGVSK